MNDNSVRYSESADAIIAQAKVRGLTLTRRSLAEWHRAGLLPRPKKQGLGQGKGSASLYPIRTAEQAIACQIELTQIRNFEVAGWQLWLRGFCVADEYWQKPIEQARRNIRKGTELIEEAETGDPVASDKLDQEIKNFTSMANLPNPYGAIRRRLRGDRFLELFQSVLPTIIGDFLRPLFDAEDGGFERLFQNLLWGDVSKETDDLSPHLGISAAVLVEQIEKMSEFVLKRGQSLHEVDFSQDEIHVARDEFLKLIRAFRFLRKGEAEFSRVEPRELNLVIQLFFSTPIAIQAALILGWAYFREIPGWSDRLNSIISDIERALIAHVGIENL